MTQGEGEGAALALVLPQSGYRPAAPERRPRPTPRSVPGVPALRRGRSIHTQRRGPVPRGSRDPGRRAGRAPPGPGSAPGATHSAPAVGSPGGRSLGRAAGGALRWGPALRRVVRAPRRRASATSACRPPAFQAHRPSAGSAVVHPEPPSRAGTPPTLGRAISLLCPLLVQKVRMAFVSSASLTLLTPARAVVFTSFSPLLLRPFTPFLLQLPDPRPPSLLRPSSGLKSPQIHTRMQ